MSFLNKENYKRWILIISSFLITILILWNTYTFFQIFKNEERIKMELFAQAQKSLNNSGPDTDVDLPFQIISNNTTIPLILTDQDNKILDSNNIDPEVMQDSISAKILLQRFKNENVPIKLEISKGIAWRSRVSTNWSVRPLRATWARPE